MAKSKIVPITKVSQITPQYIKDSMKSWYSADVTNKMTDLFAQTLAFDYKRKAKNLKWLFGDDTTITIDADPEEVLASLRKNDARGIRPVLAYLDSVGATYTAESLSNKKCTYNKQVMRVKRVIEMTLSDTSVSKTILSGQSFDYATKKPYTIDIKTGVAYTALGVVKAETANGRGKPETTFTDGDNLWVKAADGMYECHAEDNLTIVVKGGIRDHNIDQVLGQIQGGSIVLSMDLNDMITCSNGGVSSCMGFSGSYHLGWMMTFRSDFGLIAYLKNPDDRFHKIGRQWVHLRLTKDGMVFDTPAMKFMQNYGQLNEQHVELTSSHILKVFEDKFKIKASDFKKETGGSFGGTMASLNVTSGSKAGYLDGGQSRTCPAFALKKGTLSPKQPYAFPELSGGNFEQGTQVVFDFQEALSIDGVISNGGQFSVISRSVSRPNTSGKAQYKLVTCDVTKESVLDVECTFIPDVSGAGGKYIQSKLLLQAFDPELLPKEEPDVVEEPVVAEPETIEEDEDFDETDF